MIPSPRAPFSGVSLMPKRGHFFSSAGAPQVDWDAFRRLTSAMYDVADEAKGSLRLRLGSRRVSGIAIHSLGLDQTPRFTPNAGRLSRSNRTDSQFGLLLFIGESPYKDDTLRKKAKG